MMNSYQRTKQQRRIPRSLVVTLGLVLLVIASNYLSHQRLSAASRASVAYVWNFSQANIGLVSDSGIFATKNSLAHENARLRALVEMLQEQKMENDLLVSENQALRQLAHTAPERSVFVTARVVSSVGSSLYDTFTASAGSADGVKAGAIVLGPGSVAIGVVSSVSEHSALVALYTKAGQKVPVTITGATAVTMVGHGKGAASIDVPRGLVVGTDTPVLLASTHAVIGAVVHVDSKPSDALQKVYVVLPFDPATLLFVRIETQAP